MKNADKKLIIAFENGVKEGIELALEGFEKLLLGAIPTMKKDLSAMLHRNIACEFVEEEETETKE